MKYSLNALYKVADLTKQAVWKHRVSELTFNAKLEELLVQVDMLKSEHPGCGIEKMYYTLQPDFMGRDRFIEIMMGFGYRVKKVKNYIRTTFPSRFNYPNLIEGNIVKDVNRVWQSDITYILVDGDYYYVVFIIDIYSKRIVGFQASNHMRAEANLGALNQGLKLRSGQSLNYLIHHSDRGAQYGSKVYTKRLKQNGIAISMGLKATDNAYAERINGIIKNEYLNYREMKTLSDLKKELKKAVHHYNYKRIHLNLSRQTPVQFENKLLHLSNQKRPTVTIHTDGYDKIKEASNLFNLKPEKTFGVHICPILI